MSRTPLDHELPLPRECPEDMHGNRVLVVDDFPGGVELVSSILKTYLPDLEVITASSGRTAIQAVAEHHPDVVLLDVKMPDIDGFEVCRRLKADPRVAHVPVLLLSGILMESQHRIRGLETGADGYLCKPFEGEELIAQVRALLRLKKSMDALRRHESELESDLHVSHRHLQESLERFRSIFENSPDAIFVEDTQGVVLDVNPAACHLHGEAREALIGRHFTELIPEAALPETDSDNVRWRTGEMTAHESYCRRADGRIVPVEIRGGPIQYDGQEAVLLHVRDVSRRKQLDDVLREMAQGFSADMGLPFFVALTRRLVEILGMRYAFVGELAADAVDRLRTLTLCDRGEIRDNFSYSLTGTPCENVMERGLCAYPRKVCEQFPEDALLAELGVESYVGIPLFDAQGQAQGLLVVMDEAPLEDTTMAEAVLQLFAVRVASELMRKRAMDELRESQARHRSLTDILDTSSVGILILNADDRVTWANQALAEYFGMARDSLVGKRHQEIMDDTLIPIAEDPQTFVRMLNAAQHHQEPDRRFEFHIMGSQSCSERWLEYRSRGISSGLYAGGRIEHYIDITLVKELEQQFLQAQKMESIGRLAGGIAHDFNNLLTSILGFSRLLHDDLQADAASQQDLKEIISAGERAAKLTRQLLAFGRRQMLEVKRINLNHVVEEMLLLLQRAVGEDIEIATHLERNLPAVEADVGQLEQVILNLAVNARDAMPHGGKLTVRTDTVELDEEACRRHEGFKPDRYVLLSIADDGAGMTEEVRRQAFDPFFTTKEVGKGTGLGLSTVYGIVKQIGGSIDLISQPGEGSDVRIYFPRQTEAAVKPAERVDDASPRGTETILLVEDEDAVREVTRRFLESHGYLVLTAEHGEAALAACRNHRGPIDLLLTDVVMPQMSGPQLAGRVHEARPNVRVMYTTGFARERVTHHGGGEHVDILQKPYDRDALLRQVRTVLDRP